VDNPGRWTVFGSEVGPLAVALLVVAIGASLAGPTGYPINPARDLGPRIAHAILPIRGKGDSNWRYAWVPVARPPAGAGLTGAFSHVTL
jgi:glycerol uptake facilitator protein